MKHEIVLKQSVLKDIKKFPQSVLEAIKAEIKLLAVNPFPNNFKKIRGYRNYYRIRFGNYRVIYEVNNQTKIITIIKIGHRKEIYSKI